MRFPPRSATLYLIDEHHRAADAGSRYQLRSVSTMALIVLTSVCSTIGDHAFPVAAEQAWNSLPLLVTSSPSLPILRQRQKTELFPHSYGLDSR